MRRGSRLFVLVAGVLFPLILLGPAGEAEQPPLCEEACHPSTLCSFTCTACVDKACTITYESTCGEEGYECQGGECKEVY